VGAYARRAARSGLDVGQAVRLGRDLGIGAELNGVIRRDRPHVAIQATCSGLEGAAEEVSTLVRHGVLV